MRLFHAACIAISLASTSHATDLLTPITSEATTKDHPYSILYLSPGMSVEDAEIALAEHFQREEMHREQVSLNIRSPKGREFKHEYAQRLTTPWIDPFVRMGPDSYEEVTVDLATDVLSNRVLAIHRTLVMVEQDRPAPEAIINQLIDTYGQPSGMERGTYDSELVYAFDANGFIADIKQREEEMHPLIPNMPSTASLSRFGSQFHDDVPCIQAFGRSAFYEFQMPRQDDPDTTCDMAFIVKIRSSAGKTAVDFHLMDFRLIRANRNETDTQILKALEAPQSSSKLKL